MTLKAEHPKVFCLSAPRLATRVMRGDSPLCWIRTLRPWALERVVRSTPGVSVFAGPIVAQSRSRRLARRSGEMRSGCVLDLAKVFELC